MDDEVKTPFYKKIADKAMEYPKVVICVMAICVVMFLVYYYSGVQYLSGKLEKIVDLEQRMLELIKSISDKQSQNLG